MGHDIEAIAGEDTGRRRELGNPQAGGLAIGSHADRVQGDPRLLGWRDRGDWVGPCILPAVGKQNDAGERAGLITSKQVGQRVAEARLQAGGAKLFWKRGERIACYRLIKRVRRRWRTAGSFFNLL